MIGLVFLIAALVLFILAAIAVPVPRVNLVAAGWRVGLRLSWWGGFDGRALLRGVRMGFL